MTVTDRFWPTVGWKLLKPSVIKAIFCGRPSGRPHLICSRLRVARSSLAPWRRPSFARSRRRVAQSRQALRASRAMIGYDRVFTPPDLAPSGGPQPNRPPRAAMDSSSCGAHVHMLGARFGVRAAEDGHLTFFRAHAALRRMGAWHVKSGCCWLLLLPPLPPTQCVLIPQGAVH